MKKDLVSIIVPVYNAEKFIEDTIQTVLSQTYSKWELILVDDCSTDQSAEIIKKYIKKDKRIRMIRNGKNSKTAISRNNGIADAKGEFLCFLDADDIWDKEKINKQVAFMKNNKYEFTFTGYEFADENGKPNGKKVFVPEKINYKQSLKNTTIWTCTVMIDMKKFSKDDIYMPNVPSEDTACWWKLLKKINFAYGMKDILSYYRRTNNSLSANKITALKRTWNLYRNVEKLNLIFSFYNFCWYVFNALKRRI